MNRKLITVLLTIVTLLPVFPVSADVDVGDFYGNYYGQAVDLGAPFEQLLPVDCVTGELNGHNMLYTTSSGTWAQFYAYDLTDQKIIFTTPLVGSKTCWTHKKNSKGIIYLCADGYVHSYDPYTNTFKSYGRALGERQSFEAAFDEEDNLYVATYPHARIAKLDAKTGEITDFLGQSVVEGRTYVRSICYAGGNLYCTTYGEGNKVEFCKVNLKTKKVDVIPLPRIEGFFQEEHLLWLYALTTAGDYIFMNNKQTSDDTGVKGSGSPLLIYNWKKGEFVLKEDLFVHFRGHHVSEVNDNKVYFISGMNGRKLLEFDLETETLTDTGIDYFSDRDNFIFGSGWMEIDDPDFPGKTLVTVDDGTGAVVFINPQSKKVKSVIYPEMKGGSLMIRSLEPGPADTITLGAYMGTRGAFYDVYDRDYTYFLTNQVESSVTYEGTTYFMTYTRAGFWQVDYSNLESGEEADNLKATIGEHQDRAFAHAAGDGKIFFGTIPDYGQLGGTLVIYDIETKEFDIIRNVVQDQSIISLDYRDGLLYGSTSVWGGGSAIPSQERAKMFVWDVAKREKLSEFYPLVPGCSYDMKAIGDIRLDENGDLWCASKNLVFCMDPQTKRVKKSVQIKENKYQNEIWQPCHLDFDGNGILYLIADNTIWAVNMYNMDFKCLNSKFDEKQSCAFMRIGPDKNLYYGGLGRLKMIPIVKSDYRPADVFELTEQKDVLGLVNGVPYFLTNGRIGMLEPGDTKVVPVQEGNNMMIPVRRICEQLGYQVGWEEDTLLVTGNDLELSAKLGERRMTVNGKTVNLSAAPRLEKERLFFPAEDLAKTIGLTAVSYSNGAYTISKEKTDEKTAENLFMSLNYYGEQFYGDFCNKEELAKTHQALLDSEQAIHFANAGFEQDPIGSTVSGFTLLYPNTTNAYCEVSDANSFLGEKSLRIVDRSDQAGSGIITQNVSLEQGEKYTLKIPLYIAEGTPSVQIEFLNSTGGVVSTELDNMADLTRNQWHILNYDVQPLDGVTGIRVSVLIHKSYYGDIFIDEMTIQRQE